MATVKPPTSFIFAAAGFFAEKRHPSGINLHLDVIALSPSDVSIRADDNEPRKDQRVFSVRGGTLPKSAIL